MPSVDYSYQLSTTCVSGVNIDALSYEIRASEITKNLHYVFVDNDSDNIIVWFREDLTSSDEDLLLYLLQNHKGHPIGMTTTSGVYPDYSKNLIINENGDGIGVSQSMPFHVTSVTVAAPHELNSESHIGQLVDSQIPSFIARDSELINASGILNTKIDNLDFYTTDEVDTIVSGLAVWDHDHDLRYIQIANQSVIDHGSISGLSDDDHTQYYNQTRGDLRYSQLGHIHDDRYYTEAEINTISGILNTKITNTSGTLQSQITHYSDHGNLSGLSDDDHTQYLNVARGDARYYTETELNNGQLDSRYYTETELNNGQLDSRYYTESEVNTISGNINAKIITDHGGLTGLSDDDHPQYLTTARADLRYYTEAEVNAISGSLNTTISNNYSTLQNVDTNLDIKINTTSGTLRYAIDNKDHGTLLGLGDDDHPHYLNQSRGDARYSQLGHLHDDRYYTESELNAGQLNNLYYTESEVNTISGAIVAKIVTDHGVLTGLGDDDHPQYHNDTRGDIRYYTKAQTDTISGALNTKIITTSGALQTNINGKSDLGHIHDDRYYTETELNNGQLDSRYYTESEVNTISGNLQTNINTKLPLTGGTVGGNLIINGNLTVSGTQFVTTTETVSISDNIIYVNAGEPGAGVTKGAAGMQVDRGTLTDYLFVFDEASDTFRVGISGSLQAVATREDTPINNYVAYWNSTASRFDTTGSMLYTDIASKSYVGTVSGVLNTKIDTVSGVLNTKITTLSGVLQTNINGKSDIGHTHDDRYYTETELNNGQLDNRYYTESEVNTISGNITAQLHPRHHGMTSTSDHTAGNNKVFYSNSSGQVVELSLSTSGTVLMSTGPTVAPVFSSINPFIAHGNEYHTSTFITSTAVNYTNLNTNGSVGTGAAQVAQGNHLHAGVYEPVISPKNTAFNVNFGTTAGTATQGNDSRLSDARTPLAHGNEKHTEIYITSSGVTYENLSANGDIGTGAAQVAQGNHGHAQLHDRSHAITSTSDHTAGNWKLFYSDGVGQVQELSNGVSGTILSSVGASVAPEWLALDLDTIPMAALQVRRTTDYTVTTSWTSLTFDTIDVRSNSAVIDRDDTDTGKIIVKEAGIYQVSYNIKFNPPNDISSNRIIVRTRLHKNDNTVIPGSSTYLDLYEYETHSAPWDCIVELEANDYMHVQIQKAAADVVNLKSETVVIVERLQGYKGEKGDKGDPGSGVNINVQDNGSSVTGSPFNTLNFKNATISGSTTSGIVDITVTSTVSPGAPTNSVQFNDAGSFAGDAGLTYDPSLDKLKILGANQTTRLVLGNETDNNNAALYIEVDGDTTSEGMRTYFKRSTAGISGWIVYHYDQATPNIRLIDEDDDPPYIAFQTIDTGTYNSPAFDNRFGTRGPVAGATTGFKWDVSGTTISEMDTQWFRVPGGTTAQRPTPTAGMTRWNSTILGMEYYDGRAWQPQVFGNYFSEASDESDSSSNSSSWNQKLRLTTASLPPGKYRIGWSYNLRGSSTSVSPQGRVQIDDTDTIHNYLYEPKDASSNEEDAIGGFYYYTVSTNNTTLNIDLDYSSESTAATTTIRRARLEFWRVS